MFAITQATAQKPSNEGLIAIGCIALLVILPIIGFIIGIILMVSLLAGERSET
jgi:preprotein translocase subunit Sss1